MTDAGEAADEVPDGRCGFSYNMSTVSGDAASQVSCWRPTWGDRDRCVWHADEDDKPAEAFEDALSDYPERLDGAVVSDVELRDADWFEGSRLIGAEFREVELRGASLAGTDFREATLEQVDARRADFTDANFEGARITESDLRAVSFIDARFDQAVFSNVRVDRQTDFGGESIYEQELSEGEQADENVDSEESYRLTAEAAIWGYREIQELYSENALPFEARDYYHREKDMRRRIAWHSRSYVRAVAAEGSCWVTGYGMNPWRVIATAVAVIVLCAVAIRSLRGSRRRSPRASGRSGRRREPRTRPTSRRRTRVRSRSR